MGQRVTPTMTAVNYGYVSPRLRGRADLDFYGQSLDYMQNYVAQAEGEGSYRQGSLYVSRTRNDNKARLLPYLFNTEQAYILEFTDGYLRFYRDNGLVTFDSQTITAITQAAAAQITVAAHGYSVNDPVFLSGISGMTQLNGVEAVVASVVDVDNFTISVDTTGYEAYVSGGAAAKIYEIVSPYAEADIEELEYTQTEDTMYITHEDYVPRKLVRGNAHTSWTITEIDFIGNPFGITLSTSNDITDISQDEEALVTYTGNDNFTNGDTILITGVDGMTEVNNKRFTIKNVSTGSKNFRLTDYDSTLNDEYGDPDDETATSGTAQVYSEFSYPSLVALFEGRIIYGASDAFPTRLWFSKIRDDGELDDFTTGTLDNDAIVYRLRADQANRLRWIAGAENYMALGTSGSEFKVSGGGDNDAITPNNISVKPTSFNGVAKTRPLRLDSYILFLQRNGRTVRSFEYNALQDGYTAPDRTLLADHIGKSKFKEFAYTSGTPNIVWGVRNDGLLGGLTFDPAQKVVAWHLHKTDGSYESVATIPEIDIDDELWCVVKRTIDGQEMRFVEYFPNPVEFSVKEDFFTGEENKEADEDAFLTDNWQKQKQVVYADSCLVYDGSGLATVGLTVAGGTDIGDVVTITADGAYFDADMATDRRRIQTPEGGQIEITGFTSSTLVDGRILYPIEDTVFASGEWFYMARSLSGINHLEGKDVSVLADGGVTESKTVSAGSIELSDDSGYALVGLKYVGIGKTQDIDSGGQNGRAVTKPRAITKMGVRLRSSLGTKFGTNLYSMEEPQYRKSGEVAGRPPRLIDGVIEVQTQDGFSEEKNIYWLHDVPLPSNVQIIQPIIETNDE